MTSRRDKVLYGLVVLVAIGVVVVVARFGIPNPLGGCRTALERHQKGGRRVRGCGASRRLASGPRGMLPGDSRHADRPQQGSAGVAGPAAGDGEGLVPARAAHLLSLRDASTVAPAFDEDRRLPTPAPGSNRLFLVGSEYGPGRSGVLIATTRGALVHVDGEVLDDQAALGLARLVQERAG